MRFGFCSTAAIDYFRATHINGLPECLSEDWYESTEPGELPRIPGALRFICIRSFDTTVNLGRVAALVSDSMLAMEVHKPELQWCMGTFQLEGSVVHQKVPEQTQEPLYGWFGPATARMEARPPADSLAYRRRVSLSASPSPQPRLIHINSLIDPQPDGKADNKHESDDANDHYSRQSRTKILKKSSSQPPNKRSRGGSLRLTLRPNARDGSRGKA